MFHPALLNLIVQDNEANAPLVNPDKLQVIIDVSIFMMCLILLLPVCYSIFINLYELLWNIFTPGRQIEEIMLINMGILLIILGKVVLDKLTNKIIKKFQYLEESNKTKDKKIIELEEKLTMLEDNSNMYNIYYEHNYAFSH